MSYKLEYDDEVADDLKEFNKSQKLQIQKSIDKTIKNPLPKNEGGLGEPLGNKHGRNLTGLCRIKLKRLGIRVVYKLIRTDEIMKVIVIAAREDDEVYDIAEQRNKKYIGV